MANSRENNTLNKTGSRSLSPYGSYDDLKEKNLGTPPAKKLKATTVDLKDNSKI